MRNIAAPQSSSHDEQSYSQFEAGRNVLKLHTGQAREEPFRVVPTRAISAKEARGGDHRVATARLNKHIANDRILTSVCLHWRCAFEELGSTAIILVTVTSSDRTRRPSLCALVSFCAWCITFTRNAETRLCATLSEVRFTFLVFRFVLVRALPETVLADLLGRRPVLASFYIFHFRVRFVLENRHPLVVKPTG